MNAESSGGTLQLLTLFPIACPDPVCCAGVSMCGNSVGNGTRLKLAF